MSVDDRRDNSLTVPELNGISITKKSHFAHEYKERDTVRTTNSKRSYDFNNHVIF